MEIETFPALQLSGLRHGFSTRSQGPLETLDADLNAAFTAAGFPMLDAVHAEQPHGNRAQAVYTPLGIRVPDIDAMATSVPKMPLVVRVADCGPVFFYDPVQQAIAVAHSGRKGTEGNIVRSTIECLRDTYQTRSPRTSAFNWAPAFARPITKSTSPPRSGRQAQACRRATLSTTAGSAPPRTSTAIIPIAPRRAKQASCGPSSCSSDWVLLIVNQKRLL